MLKYHKQSRGAALIIALFSLLLISMVVLAFLGQARLNRKISFSSASQARAGILALSALDFIKADLIVEMQSASGTAYQPSAAKNMLPYRMVDDISGAGGTVPFNLLKWSSSDIEQWRSANGFQFEQDSGVVATAVSCTTPSLNGRSIDRNRWNKPFIANNNRLSPAIDPQWVLITRKGPTTVSGTSLAILTNSSGTNPDYVIGRYAFVVYDEGGLLDVNAAGYPAAVFPASPDDDVARKGNIGFTDLSMITSNTGAINNLIRNIRNRTTAQNRDSYVEYLTGTGATANNGFLRAVGGDDAFVSRQDFLQAAQFLGLEDITPYFTTFSREKNSPSWGPTRNATDWNGQATDRNISYQYKNDRNSDSSFNRFLPGVRNTNGEPLIRHRFDLSKLNWIRHDGTLPAGVSAQNIADSFGLTRNPDGSWTYNHGSPARIKTLAEVAQENREPDFFELLQAVILRGSLGLCSGTPSNNTGEYYRLIDFSNAANNAITYRPVPNDNDENDVVSGQEKYQIIQIGANIIDQWDADNFPTEIRLNDQIFYGIENLPYINALALSVLRPAPSRITGPNGEGANIKSTFQFYVHEWLNFSLWNPHQNAATPPSGANSPTNLRFIVTEGKVNPVYRDDRGGQGNTTYNTPGNGCQGREFLDSSQAVNRNPIDYPKGPAWVGFNTTDSYYNYFAEPKTLDPDHAYCADGSNPGNTNLNYGYGLVSTGAGGWRRAAIYLGYNYVPENPFMIPSGTLLYPNYKTDQAGYGITYPKVAWNIQARPIFVPNLPKTGALTVSLQYESSPGQWRTYETIYNIMMIREQAGQPYLEDGDPLFNSPSWSEPMPDFYVDTQGLSLKGAMLKDKIRITWPNGSFNIRDARIVLPADPRTMRLNLVAHHTGPSAFITGTNIFKDSAMDDPGVTTGPHFIGFGIGNYMYSINYNLGSSTYYTDRDFVKRGGDLLHAATSTDNLFNPMSDSSVRTNRPIMLNRPFRSVAELGYVFRDDPWKSLDFFAANSADAGLLDVFYIGNSGTGTPPDVIAGKVNLNSAARDALANGGESPVLSAIISQAARDYDFSISGTAKVNSALTDTAKINTLAKALAEFSGTAPLENISDITGIFEARASAFDSSDSKGQRETLIRALTGSVQTRTWNLLIDVIAQAGRFGSNAAGLDKFIVEGEKHYWLHVAIDRFTGEIVEQQLEPVAE